MMSFADLISVACAGPTWNSVFNSVIGGEGGGGKDGLGIKRGLLFVNRQKL